jgi:hypothetical protein
MFSATSEFAATGSAKFPITPFFTNSPAPPDY